METEKALEELEKQADKSMVALPCQIPMRCRWRDVEADFGGESTPENVSKMIDEAKDFGNPMSDEEIQYEMKKANHWVTIGVGVAGYYQR